MSTILFRVNAGSEYGLGHLMRCLALAQSLKKLNVNSVFLVNHEALAICQQRQDWTGEIMTLDPHVVGSEDVSCIDGLIQQFSLSAIVIDGYTFSSSYRKQLQNLGCFVICFDDTNEFGDLHADLIVNGANAALALGYETTNPQSILCLGDEYRVMREEFTANQQTQFPSRESLLVMLGGSDHLALTLPIIKELQRQDFQHAIDIVTGAANPNAKEISNYLQSSQLNASHLHDCQNIAQIMARSRFAISAAGGSQFELQACGCPSLLLVVANNQCNATRDALQQGWCQWLDCQGADSKPSKQALAKAIVKQTLAIWEDPDLLMSMHCKANETKHIGGAQKLAQAIKQKV